MGLVYVFNAATQPLRLSINDGQSFAMQPPPKPGPGVVHPYTPTSATVARTDGEQEGLFHNGRDNRIVVQSETGDSEPVTLPVPAAPDEPGSQDLWLYLFAERLLLIDVQGRVLQNLQVTVRVTG